MLFLWGHLDEGAFFGLSQSFLGILAIQSPVSLDCKGG